MKKYILSILKVLCLVVILFVALFPLVWMGITSGKSMTELLKIPVMKYGFKSHFQDISGIR